MSDYSFEREARTPYSEAWVIEVEGQAAGRVDIHFAHSGIVQATLCVPHSFDDDDIEELIGEIDERLVLVTDPYRDDFIVTVWRGERVGVFTEELEDDDDDDDDEEGDEEEDDDDSGNGAVPRAFA